MSFFQRLFDFNSSRYRLELENEAFARLVPAGALVLDAGAGDAPYQHLFAHARYESADFEKLDKTYAESTYVCDLAAIPVADGRFDYVVFNQVMEHLPEPLTVLRELWRVLKPGGKVIYTGPLFYEEHQQPYDFYRYTQFGLKHLFANAGFTIERLDWLEGYFGTIGYQLHGMARDLPTSHKVLGGGLRGFLLKLLFTVGKWKCAWAAVFFHHLEKRIKFTAAGYPKNYVAILAKPG